MARPDCSRRSCDTRSVPLPPGDGRFMGSPDFRILKRIGTLNRSRRRKEADPAHSVSQCLCGEHGAKEQTRFRPGVALRHGPLLPINAPFLFSWMNRPRTVDGMNLMPKVAHPLDSPTSSGDEAASPTGRGRSSGCETRNSPGVGRVVQKTHETLKYCPDPRVAGVYPWCGAAVLTPRSNRRGT